MILLLIYYILLNLVPDLDSKGLLPNINGTAIGLSEDPDVHRNVVSRAYI